MTIYIGVQLCTKLLLTSFENVQKLLPRLWAAADLSPRLHRDGRLTAETCHDDN